MEAEAPDTVRFTRALKDAVALEDRAGMMQALWSVALADGVRDDSEDQVLRLGLEPAWAVGSGLGHGAQAGGCTAMIASLADV